MGEDLKQAGISGEKEKEETFSNSDEKQKLLKNRELEETLGWVGFAILTSVCQFIKPCGWHLETNEYIALVVSALGTVVGLWWQVGKSMFPDHK